MQPTDKPQRAVLTVSQLNRLARETLEDAFPMVWVSGELSNLARPASGHWYFTLKDDGAQVRCAMFRNRNFRVRFNPQAGQQLLVKGQLGIYEARGDYQLIVEEMEPAGEGALALAFNQLKEKLAAEGLFAAERKRPVPGLPHHIAVVTSPTGAAIRDILTVLERRFPAIPVTIIPTPVQGSEAAAGIARGIALANELVTSGRFDFDVILTGRGGGSLEDLWAFNEEVVARAIHGSALPVVSAVGHEVDVSIADFVADQRAPTPSAAAELLSPDQDDWRQTLDGYEALLEQALNRKRERATDRLQHLTARLKHPGERLREQRRRLLDLSLRLAASAERQMEQSCRAHSATKRALLQCDPRRQLLEQRSHLRELDRRRAQQLRHLVEQKRWQLANRVDRLQAISPLKTLARGYAILSDKGGRAVTDAVQTRAGAQLHAQLARGRLALTVDAIEPESDNSQD